MSFETALLQHLGRQERSTLARIGAGKPLDMVFKQDRWSRELAADTGVSIEVASQYIGEAFALLRASVSSAKKPGDRIVAARMAYADLRSRATRWRRDAAGSPSEQGDHLVYILRDLNDVLLYVGITDRGPVRLVEHYRSKPWFGEVCRVEFERYESRSESEAREKYLITNMAPLYNVQHNQGRHLSTAS